VIKIDRDTLQPLFHLLRRFQRPRATKEIAHKVWLEDRQRLQQSLQPANAATPAGDDALWRLGSEDPSLWISTSAMTAARHPASLLNTTDVTYS